MGININQSQNNVLNNLYLINFFAKQKKNSKFKKIKGFEPNSSGIQEMSKPIVVKITKLFNVCYNASKITCTVDSDLIELQRCEEKENFLFGYEYDFSVELSKKPDEKNVYELFFRTQKNGNFYIAFNIINKSPYQRNRMNDFINLDIRDEKDLLLDLKIKKKSDKWASKAGLNSTYQLIEPQFGLILSRDFLLNPSVFFKSHSLPTSSIQQVSKPSNSIQSEPLLPSSEKAITKRSNGKTRVFEEDEFAALSSLTQLNILKLKPNM